MMTDWHPPDGHNQGKGELKRHRWVGEMNAFSCTTTCGLPMDHPIHYTYDEVDMIEIGALERAEAAREDGDPEC